MYIGFINNIGMFVMWKTGATGENLRRHTRNGSDRDSNRRPLDLSTALTARPSTILYKIGSKVLVSNSIMYYWYRPEAPYRNEKVGLGQWICFQELQVKS
jgi:hypothetical protein